MTIDAAKGKAGRRSVAVRRLAAGRSVVVAIGALGTWAGVAGCDAGKASAPAVPAASRPVASSAPAVPVVAGPADTRPAAASVPTSASVPSTAPTPAAPASSPAAASPLAPPKVSDAKPTDYPGLHNVVAYAADVLVGAVPEGAAGFDSLARLGVKTILTVDGAEPELEPAKARGMRYVHLPITYAGFDEARKLEIARAVRDLPRPVYVHCHHGKHRSAAAAGAALVTLGDLTPDQAVAKMKVSGTAPNYTGLYACAAGSGKVLAALLDKVGGDFPEVSRPHGTVKTMIAVDEASDGLKAAQKAGWKAPADHPDLDPAAEAGKLADFLRVVTADAEAMKDRPAEYKAWMLASSKAVEHLEAGLTATGGTPATELDKRWAAAQQTCKQCHAKYRD